MPSQAETRAPLSIVAAELVREAKAEGELIESTRPDLTVDLGPGSGLRCIRRTGPAILASYVDDETPRSNAAILRLIANVTEAKILDALIELAEARAIERPGSSFTALLMRQARQFVGAQLIGYGLAE